MAAFEAFPPELGQAIQTLLGATDRNQVLDTFFSSASSVFDYAALFTVQGGLGRGRLSRLHGGEIVHIEGILVALNGTDSVSEAVRRGEPRWIPPGVTGVEPGLAADLGRASTGRAVVLPILVRNRCVLFLYGDAGEADLDTDRVNGVLALLPFVSSTLERLILQRKLTEARSDSSHPVPTSRGGPREEEAGSSPLSAPVDSEEATAADSSPPETELRAGLAKFIAERYGTDSLAPAESPAAPRGLQAPGRLAASLPFPGERPSVGFADSVDPKPEVAQLSADAEELPPPRGDSEGSGLALHTEVEKDCLELFDRVVQGDEFAQSVLVEMGSVAARVLAARLPGPLPGFSREGMAPAQTLAEWGPLLATLVKIGWTALPALIKEAHSFDPNLRKWATLVLGELSWPESVVAVVERLADSDPSVSQAALQAASRLWATRTLREEFRLATLSLARSANQSPSARIAAVRSLGSLRDDRAVPALSEFLSDAEPSIAAAAHQTLIFLTGQDFGLRQASYSDWWSSHRTAHRIEWLIDALAQEQAELRRGAIRELQVLTRETQGYDPDLSAKERALGQQRWRDWWGSRGKSQFR